MLDCLVLGSGRSGTSLVAGMLDRAGYYTGDNYLAGRLANPRGFFEDSRVNSINDALLKAYRPGHTKVTARWRFVPWLRYPRLPGWWSIPTGPLADPSPHYDTMEEMLSQRPFAYKDPRFAFTVDLWPIPQETRFICVFRHPSLTVDSMIRERAEVPWLQQFYFDEEYAYRLWAAVYKAILGRPAMQLFVHYEQLISGEGVEQISDYLEVNLDPEWPDRNLSRSAPSDTRSREAEVIYARLCDLAGYEA